MNLVQTEAKTSEECIETMRDAALSRYRGVLRSFRGIVKAADERIAGQASTLNQLQLLFEGAQGDGVRVSSWLRERLWTAESESAPGAKALRLQMLPGLASKNSIARAKDSGLSSSFDTLGRERREVVTFTHDVQDLASHSKKPLTDAERLRKWDTELAGELRKRMGILRWDLLR